MLFPVYDAKKVFALNPSQISQLFSQNHDVLEKKKGLHCQL